MVGVHRADGLVAALGQHSDIVLPQIVGMDQLNTPFPAQICQDLGGRKVIGAAHFDLAARDGHGLHSFYQQAGFIVGEIGLHPPVSGQVADQGFHIALCAGLAGVIEKVQDFHSGPPLRSSWPKGQAYCSVFEMVCPVPLTFQRMTGECVHSHPQGQMCLRHRP